MPAPYDVQWAFRTTEWLAADNYSANAAAIKQIGREYHLVTRQTSLLALEPGMNLWPDTLSLQPDASGSGGSLVFAAMPSSALTINNSFAAANPTRDAFSQLSYQIGGNQYPIDSIPLENLQDPGNSHIAIVQNSAPIRTAITAAVSGGTLVVLLPPVCIGAVGIALYNMSGRRLSSQTIDASRQTAGRVVIDLHGQRALARGNYMLRVTSAGYDQTFRIPVLGK